MENVAGLDSGRLCGVLCDLTLPGVPGAPAARMCFRPFQLLSFDVPRFPAGVHVVRATASRADGMTGRSFFGRCGRAFPTERTLLRRRAAFAVASVIVDYIP